MSIRRRVIPVLSTIEGELVKTTKYKDARYLGDPLNAVKIFNDKGVDELILLDIRATSLNMEIKYNLLESIAKQAFMPLAYGGGLKNISQVKRIISMGYEKVIFSSSLFTNPDLIRESVKILGSQSVVASIDVKRNLSGRYAVYINSGRKKVASNVVDYVKDILKLGVGEIIINSVNEDGVMKGYDYGVLKLIEEIVTVPVVANCGASGISDFKMAFSEGYDAVAASSIFVFFGRLKAVLINYPEDEINKFIKEGSVLK